MLTAVRMENGKYVVYGDDDTIWLPGEGRWIAVSAFNAEGYKLIDANMTKEEVEKAFEGVSWE